MALWPETVPETAELSSRAVSLRAGGGSPCEPAPGLTRTGAGPAMRKELRLRRRKDFDAVFRRGRAWNNEFLVLRTLPNGLDHNRYGFVTSKRVGHAVVRNKVRRRLREAVRVLPAEPGWDIVISAKRAAAQAGFQELNRAVTELLGRARILKKEGAPEVGA